MTRCCAWTTYTRPMPHVSRAGLGFSSHQCPRAAKVEHQGQPYCTQHDPERQRKIENRKRLANGYPPRPALPASKEIEP